MFMSDFKSVAARAAHVFIAVAIVVAGALPTFGEDPCLQTTKLDPSKTGVQSWTGKKGSEVLGNKGTDDAYGVETWTEAGGDKTKFTWYGPNQGGGFAYKAEWTESTDYLGRFGYFWGIDGKKWDKLGDLCVDYNYTRSKNGTGGNYSYIGVYGWTISSGGNGVEAEYYIVEDWFGENQQAANNLGDKCQTHSDITVDGKTYQVVTCERPAGSGCVTCNGKAFGQVFSIRKNMRNPQPATCGTISIKKHFEEWTKQKTEKSGQSPAKYIYEKTYESKFLAEAQGGTGWLDATFIKFARDGKCGFDIPANNFTLAVSVSPSEGGTVSRTPSASYYPSGTSVSLTATPASGWQFAGWGGDASGTGATASVTINANKTVVAKFSPVIDPNKNLVTNGDFAKADGWTFNSGSSYGNSEGSFNVSSNKAAISITKTGSKVWEPQFVQNGITLVEGMKYRLAFDAYASANRKIGVTIQMAGGDYTTYFEDTAATLTTTSKTFTYEFEMKAPSDENGRIGFNLGQATGTVTLSNVKLNYVSGTSGIAGSFRPTQASAKPTLRAVPSASGVKVSFKASESGAATLRLYSLKGDVLSTVNLQTVSGKSYTSALNPAGGKLPGGFYMVGLQRGGGAVERMAVLVR